MCDINLKYGNGRPLYTPKMYLRFHSIQYYAIKFLAMTWAWILWLLKKHKQLFHSTINSIKCDSFSFNDKIYTIGSPKVAAENYCFYFLWSILSLQRKKEENAGILFITNSILLFKKNFETFSLYLYSNILLICIICKIRENFYAIPPLNINIYKCAS